MKRTEPKLMWFRELVNNREQFIYYLNYKALRLVLLFSVCERHSWNMTFNVKRIKIYMLKCLVLHFNRLVNCVHVPMRQYIEHIRSLTHFVYIFFFFFFFFGCRCCLQYTIDTLNHILVDLRVIFYMFCGFS